ncbi:MAG: extracellular solute-binding protein [Thermotogaceae bacterium]|nr:extracellular solute-binding protein [Thermotogaceae bacterium]
MRRVISVLLLVFTVFLAFSAPYNTTIKVLAWDDALTQALKEGIPDFEKQTGIKVVLELIPSGNLLQKIGVSVSTDKSDYDLVTVDEPYVPALAHLFTPFNNWSTGKVYKKPNLSVFAPNAFDAAQWMGTFVGMPVNANVYIWITRKDIINDPKNKQDFKSKYGYNLGVPKTFKELRDMAEFFSTKGIYGFAPFTKQAEGTTAEAIFMFEGFGTRPLEIVNNRVVVALDDKKAVEAINFYKELLKFSPVGALDMGHSERIAAFNQGKVFTMFQWPALVPQHEDPNSSLVAGKITYSAPPVGPAGASAIRGCWVLGMPNASKNKDAAAEFAYWWASLETGTKLVPKGFTPSRSDILLNPTMNKDRPWFKAIFDSMKGSIARPRFPQYAETSQIIRDNWLAAISGKVTPESAVKKMKDDLNDLLKKLGY